MLFGMYVIFYSLLCANRAHQEVAFISSEVMKENWILCQLWGYPPFQVRCIVVSTMKATAM